MSKKVSPVAVAEESSYEKQANDFLTKTKSTLSVKFLKNDFHSNGDKDTRDIYSCVLKRGKLSHKIKFGQSIVNTEKGLEPTAYDILCCLQKYDAGSFENFCGDFGYNSDSISDSRKARKTYNAVRKEYEGLAKMYS
jgi:hypothetical protein